MSAIFNGPHAHYSIDRPLMKRLGLDTKPLPHCVETLTGCVKVGAVKVKIFATAMPAKFWRFEFKRPGMTVVVHESDSGSLSTYWPMVVEIVQRIKGGRNR